MKSTVSARERDIPRDCWVWAGVVLQEALHSVRRGLVYWWGNSYLCHWLQGGWTCSSYPKCNFLETTEHMLQEIHQTTWLSWIRETEKSQMINQYILILICNPGTNLVVDTSLDPFTSRQQSLSSEPTISPDMDHLDTIIWDFWLVCALSLGFYWSLVLSGGHTTSWLYCESRHKTEPM